MSTSVATTRNFGDVYPVWVRDRYWSNVKRAMTDIFRTSHHAADRYQRSIEGAPVDEQMLAYHQEPLSVAADLAGIPEITEEHIRQYRQLIGSDEPAQLGLPDNA